jgi:formamidopyrimidine-DNA glycosylase
MNIKRRGKALILGLDNGRLFVVQLMMTGQLVDRAEPLRDKMTRVSLSLSNGRYLHYNDQRLFGRLQVVDNLKCISYFQKLGPEPLTKEFSVSFLEEKLQRKNVPVKPLLMDHTFVAGIGNIYASEILFQSGIDPRRPAHRLKAEEIQRLHAATREVLKRAVRSRGTSINTYRDADGKKGLFLARIRVYGRDGQPCLGCKHTIEKIIQRGRGTFYCPRCQR